MKIRKLQVTLEPYRYGYVSESTVITIKVLLDDREIVEELPHQFGDDFKCFFDFLMEQAVKKLKEHLEDLTCCDGKTSASPPTP